jgi:hypothetical protein
MHKKTFLRVTIGILFASVFSLQAGILAHAESPFLTKKPLTAKTVKSLLQKIVGTSYHGAIWKDWGYELSNNSGTISMVGRIVYRPFASSKDICRTYETVIKTPSPWATRASTVRTPNKSYEIHSFLYMVQRKNDKKCSSIKFSKYFRVNREMTDQQARRFLGYVEVVLKDWNVRRSTTRKATPISLGQLRRIDIEEKDGKPVAEFDF